MTLSQMVIAGLALTTIVLVVIVARLSSQLTQLSRQVGALRTSTEPTLPSSPTPSPPPSPAQPVRSADPAPSAEKPEHAPQVERPISHQGHERDEDVRVITNLDDHPDPDRDLTTARIASVTLGGPLIKVAALSHGVRRALREEHRMRIAYVVRKELRRQRKVRRRGRADGAASEGWRP
ncbi:MAG: hypothetical protein M3445_06365 [Actinomycetota bacterium]|nr:hypothetical protein [Actinomycetota bacterium]